MSDWTLINITFTNHYLSIQGWQAIADLIGGEVKSAQEWGFTSISGLWSTTPSLSTLAVYVPEDANYGLINYGGWSGGSPDTRMYIIPMTGGDVTSLGAFGGGLDEDNAIARVFVGDGYSVIAPLDNVLYYRVCGFDTVHDVCGDRDFKAFIAFGQGVGNPGIFDLENGYTLYNTTSNEVFSGTNITQNDGQLYMEILNVMVTVSNLAKSLIATFYVCEHFYRRFYGYATREKTVIINGIKFTTPLGSEIYFPVE